jgi:hypothetical protein
MLATVYKSVVAFLGVVVTGVAGITAFINGIKDNPAVVSVLPPEWTSTIVAWGAIITVIGGAVTGVLAWLVRNRKTIDNFDAAIAKGDFSLSEVKQLVAKWDAAHTV